MGKGPFSIIWLLAGMCFFLQARTAISQTAPADTSRKIIQLSGIVVDNDSLNSLPFVAIIVRNSTRGVYSNVHGYYSIVAQERDTIDFYTLGYWRATFVLEDTFRITNNYNHVQTMRLDTIFLREAVIYPWPSKDRFKDAFLSAHITPDDLERARFNLAQAEMVQAAQSIAMDGNMAASAALRQRTDRNYYAGQAPPNNLLNPVAWSKFIQAMKNGDLKQ
ncbi:MAG TPA: carboxypeptidase-like regulatory domain-containing protein [Bacteroidia bacterium]|nr:carboxypeptidase-like regulatory domain-containing protein [Bacteroidia bacterium]